MDVLTCRSCGKHTQPEWVACPFCGTPSAPSCPSCGQSVDAAWMTCPHCATSLTTLAASSGDGDASVESLAIRGVPELSSPEALDGQSKGLVSFLVLSRISATLRRERNRIVSNLDNTAFTNSQVFRRVLDDLSSCIAEDLNAYADRIDLGFRVNADDIESTMQSHRNRLARILDELVRAEAAAEAADIPRSTIDTVLTGVMNAERDGYVSAGVSLGMILGPLGAMAGAAIGGMVGGIKRNAEVEQVLNRYRRAFDELAERIAALEVPLYTAIAQHVDSLFPGTWVQKVKSHLDNNCKAYDKHLKEAKPREGFIRLVSELKDTDNSFFGYSNTTKRLAAIYSFHYNGDTEQIGRIRKDIMSTYKLPPWETFHYDPGVLEPMAGVFCTMKMPNEALATIREARIAGGSEAEIGFAEAQAYLELGRAAEAEDAITRAIAAGCRYHYMWVFLADALCLQGRHDEAAGHLADALGHWFSVARLRSMLVDHPAEKCLSCEPLRSLVGSNGVRAMVRAWFTPDTSCLVEPSDGQKLDNARERFIHSTSKNEPVLLLLDDTLWGSSKNGIALTKDKLHGCKIGENPFYLSLKEHNCRAMIESNGLLSIANEQHYLKTSCPEAHRAPLARLINATGTR